MADVKPQNRQQRRSKHDMRDVEHPIACPPHRRQCGRSNGRERNDPQHAADDVAFLDLRREQVLLYVEVHIQRRMDVEQDRDDAAEELVQGVQALVAPPCEVLEGRVRRFERQQVVKWELGASDDAKALREVEVV